MSGIWADEAGYPERPLVALVHGSMDRSAGLLKLSRQLDHAYRVKIYHQLHELLGKGGMGYVFRAEHVKLGREVALKLLRGDYAKRRDAVLRFFQEAKTVNRVRHRNIVDVTDFVELDDGTTFIIMEFLRGQSLGRWALTGIDLPRALAVLVQICDPVEARENAYTIDDVLVSDFVTPAYYAGGDEPFDMEHLVRRPLEVLKGGYLSWHDPDDGHWWQLIFFEDEPEFRDLGEFESEEPAGEEAPAPQPATRSAVTSALRRDVGSARRGTPVARKPAASAIAPKNHSR